MAALEESQLTVAESAETFLRLCRTPHVCVGTLVLVTFLQCGLSVWHYSQPVPATFQENGWEGVEEVRRS